MPPGELEGQVNTKITTRLKTDLPSHPVTEWVELREKKKGGGAPGVLGTLRTCQE